MKMHPRKTAKATRCMVSTQAMILTKCEWRLFSRMRPVIISPLLEGFITITRFLKVNAMEP